MHIGCRGHAAPYGELFSFPLYKESLWILVPLAGMAWPGCIKATRDGQVSPLHIYLQPSTRRLRLPCVGLPLHALEKEKWLAAPLL